MERLLTFFFSLFPMSIKRSIYRIPWLANSVRQTLNKILPYGLSQVEISAGLLQGYQMSLDLQQEKDYWLGTYEPNLQDAIRDWVKPGMTAYDIGANVGYITLMLARRVGSSGQVLAFEPLPPNVERLKLNMELNHLDERVEIYPMAVIDETKQVEFWSGPSDDMGKVAGSAGREGITYSTRFPIPAVSLDDFVFKQGHPIMNVIKMDIEGGEVLALAGMKQLLLEIQPFVFLELHGKESAQVAWQIFRAANYTMTQMGKGYPPVMSLDQLDWKSYLVAFPPHFERHGLK